jgi:hypothetical protein
MRVGSRSRIAWSLAAAGLFASQSAAAQDINLTAKAEQQAGAPRHPRGTYMGVKPGGNEAPGLHVKAGQTPASVTWPGFQMQPDGSSRVFIQTTVPVDPNVSAGGRRVVVDLGDAQVVGPRANRLPFYTQFFNTPVTSVELTRERKGKSKRTLLVIKLRADVQPRVSSEVAPSGFNFVYFDFPAGQYLANAPAAAPPPPTQADSSVLNQPPPSPSGDAPSHLDGEVNARGAVTTPSAAANARLNAELPPGMGKTKAKAKGGFAIGK